MKPDTTLVSLSMRELDRLKVIQAIVEIGLKPGVIVLFVQNLAVSPESLCL